MPFPPVNMFMFKVDHFRSPPISARAASAHLNWSYFAASLNVSHGLSSKLHINGAAPFPHARKVGLLGKVDDTFVRLPVGGLVGFGLVHEVDEELDCV